MRISLLNDLQIDEKIEIQEEEAYAWGFYEWLDQEERKSYAARVTRTKSPVIYIE
jgi:hypothetical protein